MVSALPWAYWLPPSLGPYETRAERVRTSSGHYLYGERVGRTITFVRRKLASRRVQTAKFNNMLNESNKLNTTILNE